MRNSRPSADDRVAALERRCHRLTIGITILGCTTALSLTLGLTQPGHPHPERHAPEVEASRFHLRAANGDLLAQLSPQGEDQALGGSLLLLGRGKCHVDLSAGEGPSLTLNDRHGQARIIIGLDDGGHSRIELLDAAGQRTWSTPPPTAPTAFPPPGR